MKLPVALSLFHGSCSAHMTYKMSCGEYERLRYRSMDRCERCLCSSVRIVIDHDHTRGIAAVRGLICDKCNSHLSRVDTGWSPVDAATRSYLINAWHLIREGRELRYDPAVEVEPHRLSRHDMAELVRMRDARVYNSHAKALRTVQFEHEGVAAAASAGDFRPVLRLLWLTKLHPSCIPLHPKYVKGPRGRLVLPWP